MKTIRSVSAFLAALILLGTGSLLQAGDDRRHRHHDRYDRYDRYDRHYRHDRHRGGIDLSFGFFAPPPVVYERPVVVHQPVVIERNVVADVQYALNRRGYNPGIIDGVMGHRTRSAIAAYQANRGMYPSGQIDYALLRSLGLS